MPKVPTKARTKPTRSDPITKSSPKTKEPKDSHLYTDDNPATTIHGTGFKDRAAAQRTLDLIKNRSLIYQFQTVNTLFHRAKHHPSMKKAAEGASNTADMRAAMDTFEHWLEVTYPAEKDGLRAGGFKPLLSKKVVERYLSKIDTCGAVDAEAKQFAKLYTKLGARKKLGNVLVDDAKPTEADWEKRRYTVLDGLVGEGKEEEQDGCKLSELWTDDREVSDGHLQLIAWAWSPVPEKKLPQ